MFDGFRWRRRLSDVFDLLLTDRGLLLAGAIRELAKLDGRRKSAETTLTSMPEEVAEREIRKLERIRKLASRNQRLLTAYLAGARRAAERLKAIAEAERDMGAYRRDGSRIKGGEVKRSWRA